jgi:hypothetical protein
MAFADYVEKVHEYIPTRRVQVPCVTRQVNAVDLTVDGTQVAHE